MKDMSYISSPLLLLKSENVGLARLLITIYEAGPNEGIATYDLLHKIGSTHHGKTFIKRAEREGLIKRKAGKPTTPGQFAPVYNFITAREIELLKKSLNIAS
ncbi:MAG: hypothetical protein ACRD5B_11675 [Nitrososphaeraceae archaeon]